jgi:VWFA-related protein
MFGERLRERKYVLPALAAGAYLISAVAAAAVGFRFWVPWVVYQLLDAAELRRAPVGSLLALHAQPPVLNAVLAAALRLGTFLGCGPEPILSVLFFLLGGAVVVLLAQLVRALTGSFWLAMAAVLLTVADPALHVYRTVFFYELPLAFLLLAGLAAAWRFLAGGGERYLILFVLAMGGMCLTRSLYHPLWAAGMLCLLAVGRARLAPGRLPRGIWVRSAALLVFLLGVWPFKNALLFGLPVMSSWEGYNLSRGTPVRNPALWSYLETGTVSETLRQQWQERQRGAPAFLRDAPVLVAPEKSDGGRNWNHYTFLLTDRELASDALRWRREHPGAWLRQSLVSYLLWGRASYLDSYWEVPRGPDHPLYRRYARWHERLLFPDLRGVIVWLSPAAAVHGGTVVWGGPAPYTLFTIVGLPILLIALAVLLPRRLRRHPKGGPEAWVALLAACALLWVLIIPCLTDGTEGNRMRYPVSSCGLLLAAWTGATVLRSHRSRGAIMTRNLSSVPLVLSLFLLPAAAGAQEAEKGPTFYESLDVQVVNVEVFVTDKSGKRVTGLTRDDFQLLEDGKPIEITNFFAVAGEPAEAPAAAPVPADTAGAAGAATPPPAPPVIPPGSEQRLHLAIVIDDLSLVGPTRNRLLKSIREQVIPRLRPDELALVAAYEGGSVELVQGLTADKALLLAALDKVAKGAPRGVERAMDRRRLLQQIDQADLLGGDRSAVAEAAAREAYGQIQAYSRQRYEETRGTLGALTRFVDTLAGLPGRKALLYMGGGLSARPSQTFFQAWQVKFSALSRDAGASSLDGFDDDLTRFFDELAQHANSNRVTLYSLGATEQLAGASAEAGGSTTWSAGLEAIETNNLTEPLHQLADGTGGLASVNTVNPGPILARMCEDFDAYYSLGFVPRDRQDRKNHRIEVALRNRRDLVVRHRTGRRERPNAERMSDRTLAALLLDPGENPLEVALDVVRETKNDKGQLLVEVLVKFPLARLVLLPQGNFHEGKVSVWVGTRDLRGRNSTVQEIAVPIRVPNDQLLTALGQTAAYKMPLLLRPEEHRIAVTVRDELGNVDSAVTAAFTPGQTVAKP